MTFEFLKDFSNLNQAVIQQYLSGKLSLHAIRDIESQYDSDANIRQLFEMQGAIPFHLKSVETAFDELTVDELLEVVDVLESIANDEQDAALTELFDRLIAPESTLTDGDYAALRGAELDETKFDRVGHTITAGALGVPAKEIGGEPIRSSNNYLALHVKQRLLRLTYPESSLSHGLAWVVCISNERHTSRQLIPLEFSFGAWIGSMSTHLLTSQQAIREEDFYVVPVTEHQLQVPSVNEEVNQFIQKLPAGTQRTHAEAWLAKLKDKGTGESQ